jgi:hypothetical protein
MHFKQETEGENSELIRMIPDRFSHNLPLRKYYRFEKIGNCYALYNNSEKPILIIGPDCKGSFKKGRFSLLQISL